MNYPAGCLECGSAKPEGWAYCRTCHAWNDLWIGIQHAASIGVDEARLKRGLRIVAPKRRAHPIKVIMQLLDRVETLERRLRHYP